MDRDGTKKGYDNLLNRSISDSISIPIIASGGAGSLAHLVDGVLEGRAEAVLAASIFHFGELTIKEVKNEFKRSDIPVRNII